MPASDGGVRGREAGPGAVGAVSPAELSVGRRLPSDQVAELQRARLLRAAVAVFDELGFARTSVGHIATRARVSRRTFYELFAGREMCLAAILEDAVDRVERELAQAGLADLSWRDRLREALWRVLCFLDREPALARVCVVQALMSADPLLLGKREELFARLTAVVDEGRREGSRGAQCSPLVAEGLVGAGLAIAHARLARDVHPSLRSLLGELMGLLVLPYLGPAAARRERARPLPAPVALAPAEAAAAEPARGTHDLLEGVSMRVTYRTVRTLEAVGDLEGASNRAVGERAGVHDPGQISKLLSRLERLGLLVNRGAGVHTKGEPNAWALTSKGRRLAHSLRLHDRSEAA